MSAIKMDELLVSWLGREDVYESVMELIENYRATSSEEKGGEEKKENDGKDETGSNNKEDAKNKKSTNAWNSDSSNKSNNNKPQRDEDSTSTNATKTTASQSKDNSTNARSSSSSSIPPFYPVKVAGRIRKRRQMTVSQKDTWDPLPEGLTNATASSNDSNSTATTTTAATDTSPLLMPQLLAENNHNNKLKKNASDADATNVSSPTSHKDGNISNTNTKNNNNNNAKSSEEQQEPSICVRDQTMAIFAELGQDPPLASPTSDDDEGGGGGDPNNGDAYAMSGGGSHSYANNRKLSQKYLTVETFVRVTKDICGFPSFFNIPLYARILYLWNTHVAAHVGPAVHAPMEVITLEMMEWFWKMELEPYDPCDRFFRLVAQVNADAIVRDDFLPFIKALLQDHPGLEFLSSHAEFQEKYAVTVITRIFYCVNTCHSGRITARQVRRSDLLEAFQQVDEEEDINKVTRYFSYEHFYVLYCRFWELDHDRDYRITREDLLKYGDQSLSHMIVDRIFDAAPRPFEPQQQQQLLLLQQQQDAASASSSLALSNAVANTPMRPTHRDYLSYEDFIYFMLSEEDKSNEVSVKYWFTCVDVDGDGKLNNMELRSFYAVQLHRMQFMGHEMVPFEDMLCQMMDMIKPAHNDYLVETDFLQPECRPVSGALFDALFNLNKYLLFEQRDPFAERQKREDEFDCDWDRFACLDYSRLAMEEEAREEEAMEIDWVTVDDDDEDDEEEEEDEDDDEEDDMELHAAQAQQQQQHFAQQQQQHFAQQRQQQQMYHHSPLSHHHGHHPHHPHAQQLMDPQQQQLDDLQHTDDESESGHDVLQGGSLLASPGGGGGQAFYNNNRHLQQQQQPGQPQPFHPGRSPQQPQGQHPHHPNNNNLPAASEAPF